MYMYAGLQELSKYPNVYAKVSGMFHTDPKWNQQSFEEVVKPVLEIFGIDRYIDNIALKQASYQ